MQIVFAVPFRVLNVFAHVIDEIVPGPPQMKTSLPSLPQAPSLSPIKRRAKGEKDTGSNPGTPGQDSKTTQKQSQKGQLALIYSRLWLSRLRLSRITAYLKEKISSSLNIEI